MYYGTVSAKGEVRRKKDLVYNFQHSMDDRSLEKQKIENQQNETTPKNPPPKQIFA